MAVNDPAESQSAVSRVLRSTEKAQSHYDRLSRWYRLFIEPTERAPRRVGLTALSPALGERVLEIGFGAGEAILALARDVGSSGLVCGIDLALGMARTAQGRVRRAGFAKLVHLTCGEAVALPHAGSLFDAVFLCFVLELFDTPAIPAVLAECHRVLREEGRICVVALSKTGRPGAPERFYELLHERFPTTFDCRPIHVGPTLTTSGFEVASERADSLWGLPVSIVLASKTNLH